MKTTPVRASLQYSLLLLLLAGTARATEYFVATNGLDTGANHGTNWSQPLLTISNAVAKAVNPGDIVTVSNGWYGISASIAVSAGITVRSYGGGVNGGLANAALTTVYCSANSLSIFSITHASAVVDGFTITGGYASGGGVNMTLGLVRDCIIRNNNIGDNKNGGGVYMTGGTVSNCVVKSNSKNAGSGEAGGLYATGGTIVFCEIVDNSSNEDSAGGIYANGAVTIRNCLIARNTANKYGGGVYVLNNSVVIESCTIVANYAGDGTQGGGGIHRAALGTIRNCIVYNNTSGSATYKNAYSTSTSGWTYNCTALPDVNGTSCTNGDPLLRNRLEGNYLLSTGSPCIDTGTDGVVTWGTDFSGNARKQDIPGVGTASVDMGAYEYNSPLSCDFLASPRALIASPTTYQSFGPAPLTVQFTGWADGTNLTGLVYRWDFDNDGNYDDESGSVVSYTYTNAGVYNPRLQVTNDASEVAEKIRSAYVSAGNTHYVVTNNPAAAAPYTSWATAASNNIQAAINAATLNGSVVIVSNGTYGITAQITNINILTVRSFEGGLSGASNTVVQRSSGNTRIFLIGNTYAVVEGLTIRNGNFGSGAGGGVNMSAGLVRDCIIRENGYMDNNAGGGVYMTGGTVSNCIITANKTGTGNSTGNGAGVSMTGGWLLYCQIYANDSLENNGGKGAGIYINGSATVRNCLIRNNTAQVQGGGVYVDNSGALVESCTIVTNRANGGSNAGGGVYRGNGTVRNCVVYLNTAPNNTANANLYAGSGATEYSASDPQPAGTGNILAGVTFQNSTANDYRLKPCAAVDSGSNQGWMTGALDLVENPRITNTLGVAQTVDMGAYEYLPGALEVGLFTANRTEVLAPTQVVFTALLAGTNQDSLVYSWTFGDGNTASGADKGVVTNTYANPGRFSPSLTVSNAASEGSSLTRADYVDVFGPIVYVATNSPSPAVPYTNWATAALTIGDAINALHGDVVGDAGLPGIVVLVSNGTYNITSPISIQEPIIVRSFGNGVTGGLANASNTVVKNSSTANNVYPIFRITHASTAVQGFTIRDGRYTGGGTTEYGGGVNMTGGLLSDCIVTNNGALNANGGGGGGITMTGGTVSNCLIVGNGWRAGAGNGIYMNGASALVTHSRITDHRTSFASDGGNNAVNGGGVYINNGTLRNCLVARNQGRTISADSSQGGGVYMNAGTVESCTIVSNTVTATSGGGGVYRNGNGAVTNCIIYFNTEDGNVDNWRSTDADPQPNYTCTTPLPGNGANNINAAPLFVDLAAGDYTLAAGSPCIDAGTNQAWMAGAKDLAGADRKLYGSRLGATGNPIVDMGVYETYVPPKGSVFMFR